MPPTYHLLGEPFQQPLIIGWFWKFQILHEFCKNPSRVGGWTNPFEKYYIVKLDHFPKEGWKWKMFETIYLHLSGASGKLSVPDTLMFETTTQFCWWFRNPIPNHRLDGSSNPLVNNGISTTCPSTGATPGFRTNHQQFHWGIQFQFHTKPWPSLLDALVKKNNSCFFGPSCHMWGGKKNLQAWELLLLWARWKAKNMELLVG